MKIKYKIKKSICQPGAFLVFNNTSDKDSRYDTTYYIKEVTERECIIQNKMGHTDSYMHPTHKIWKRFWRVATAAEIKDFNNES